MCFSKANYLYIYITVKIKQKKADDPVIRAFQFAIIFHEPSLFAHQITHLRNLLC